MSDSSSTSSGIGVTGLLLVAFVLAKIFEVDPVTHWSWWWVMAPLWISWGIALVVVAVFGGIYAVACLLDRR